MGVIHVVWCGPDATGASMSLAMVGSGGSSTWDTSSVCGLTASCDVSPTRLVSVVVATGPPPVGHTVCPDWVSSGSEVSVTGSSVIAGIDSVSWVGTGVSFVTVAGITAVMVGLPPCDTSGGDVL